MWNFKLSGFFFLFFFLFFFVLSFVYLSLAYLGPSTSASKTRISTSLNLADLENEVDAVSRKKPKTSDPSSWPMDKILDLDPLANEKPTPKSVLPSQR